jgi:hypothetical protein
MQSSTGEVEVDRQLSYLTHIAASFLGGNAD